MPPAPQSAPPTKNLSILVTTVFKVVDETIFAFRLNERGGRGKPTKAGLQAVIDILYTDNYQHLSNRAW